MPENQSRNTKPVPADLENLCIESVALVGTTGGHTARFRGLSPFNDSAINRAFEARPSFPAAAEIIGQLPGFTERVGPTRATHFALQFVYNYLGALGEPVHDEGRLKRIWADLVEELGTPEWTYMAICNLQNFRSDDDLLDFGEGISIRARSFEELSSLLGWSEDRLEATIGKDWYEGGAGSHVLLLETRLPKSPDNLVLVSDPALSSKFSRILLALRLFKSGFVKTGRLFYARPAKFRFGLGGISASGYSRWQPGTEYVLGAAEVAEVRILYGELLEVDAKGDAARPLGLALRSFNLIYEREFYRAEDRLVDAITAIEASLRLDSDLSFRSSFQVAGLLASDDDERVKVFGEMRTYYDTRSKIVHGSQLRAKHHAALANEERLIGLVRLLVRGFVRLTTGDGIPAGFYESIDAALQHSGKRHEIRAALGLT